MHIPILAALENEWQLLAQTPSAERRFQTWRTTDPVLAPIDNLGGVLAVANNRDNLADGDAVLASLARRAPGDDLAAQVFSSTLSFPA